MDRNGQAADFREDWERNRLNLISPIANVCRYSNKPFIWRSKDVVTMTPLAGGQATAYVCENFACQLPTTDVAEFGKLLE